MKSRDTDRYARIRKPVLIDGIKIHAPISTAQTTIVTPEFALKLSSRRGPRRCTTSALGKYCGPTVEVRADLDAQTGCKPVHVTAIIAPIPAAIGEAIVGYDVLRKAQPELSFSERGMVVRCRRGQR
jgi:hypothetical protein